MAEKIRLGLVGASVGGTWSARSHLPAVQASSDVELTAVCTTKTDSAEAARQAWGARLAFDDYRKMIASPEIDAVANRRARAVTLHSDEGGAGGRQARLLRMAARTDDRRGRRIGGAGRRGWARHCGRLAGACQSRIAAYA